MDASIDGDRQRSEQHYGLGHGADDCMFRLVCILGWRGWHGRSGGFGMKEYQPYRSGGQVPE